MYSTPRFFAVAASAGLAFAAVASVVEQVSALSCLAPGMVAPVLESGVPTNTRIWCSNGPASDDELPSATPKIVLTGANGIRIEGTQTRIITERFDVHVLQPNAQLSPESDYEVRCVDGFVRNSLRTFSFRTGAGPRVARPALPDLSKLSFQAPQDNGWGVSDYAIFDELTQPGFIVVMDFDGAAALNSGSMTGSLSHAEALEFETRLYVGDGPCGGSWPEAGTHRSAEVAFGVFDVTGAFSGWTDPISLTLPPARANPTRIEEDSEPSGIEVASTDGEIAEEVAAPELSRSDVSLNAVDSSAKGTGCQLGVVRRTAALAASPLLLLLAWGARRRRR